MGLFEVYSLLDLEPVKAKGAYLWDKNGDKYLDFYGGHAVISIGHRHRHTRPTVKRSSHSQYFGPVCNERGQLQRIFVRFGSTIAKE